MKQNNTRHFRVLVKSTADEIQLSRAVQSRFIDLCGTWLRVKGEQLAVPKDLDGDLLQWRRMSVRYGRGDFRHTLAELQSLRNFAQWTVDTNCDLRNQPRKKVDWGEGL